MVEVEMEEVEVRGGRGAGAAALLSQGEPSNAWPGRYLPTFQRKRREGTALSFYTREALSSCLLPDLNAPNLVTVGHP